jgi:hypothetical protein
MFIGTDPGGLVNIGTENFLDVSRWVEVGGTYQFMGTSELGDNLNLGTQDYTDYGLWKHLNPSNLITDSTVYAALEIIGTIMKKDGMTGSSESFYGLIDRNDVRSSVNAYLLNTTVNVEGDVNVEALESARIRAIEKSTISPWEGTGGVIATNNVLSSANAHVEGGSVTTTNGGDLNVSGMNSSLIDAETSSTIEAWEGKSAVVAFNAVGWPAQNILFNAIDALIGDPAMASIFGGEEPAQTQAYIVDSTIDVAGDLSVTAYNDAQINATVGNVNISEAALDIVIPGVMDGASAVAGGGILASNKVSSMAKAYIDYTGTRGTVTVGGAVTVQAEDNAGITSDSIAVQKAIASNTLAGVVNHVESVLDILLPGDYDYTTKSGEVTLISVPDVLPDQFSPQQIRIADDYTGGGELGGNYRFIGNTIEYLYETTGAELLKLLDPYTTIVTLSAGYAGTGGVAGSSYMFIGDEPSGEVNIGIEDYLDETRWEQVVGQIADNYVLDIDPLLDGVQADLGAQDYTNTNLWDKLESSDNLADLYPDIGNMTASDAKAVGVMFVVNDVRSAVEASIDNTTVITASPDHDATVNTTATVEKGQLVRATADTVYEYLGETG